MGVDFYWIKLSNNIARLAAFCLGLSACSPHPGSVKSAQQAPPIDACGALVKTGQPSLCILPSGESFVVGLPSAHGWQRGTHVRISVEKQGLTERWPGAIAIVSETWANIAKVSVLYQRVLTLNGGYAHKVAPDERAPVGKFIGHVARIEGQRVQLDVGKADGVVVGETYALRMDTRNDQSAARLRVIAVQDSTAWADIEDVKTPPQLGHTAIYLQGVADNERKIGKKILLALGLADNRINEKLRSAIEHLGIEVHYERREIAEHKAALELGKEKNADIVLWQSMKCAGRPCPQPRLTLVDQALFHLPTQDVSIGSPEMPIVFEGGDIDGVVGAVLGIIAFQAERFGDAEFYLTRAMTTNTLSGHPLLGIYWQLVYAEVSREQTANALVRAATWQDLARNSNLPAWEAAARLELGHINMWAGNFPAAYKYLAAVKSWSETTGARDTLAMALQSRATVNLLEDKTDDARKGYNESLALHQQIGNKRRTASTLTRLGRLDVEQGHFYDARKHFESALAIYRQLDDSRRNVSTRMRQRLRKFYEGTALAAAARVSRRGVLTAA